MLWSSISTGTGFKRLATWTALNGSRLSSPTAAFPRAALSRSVSTTVYTHSSKTGTCKSLFDLTNHARKSQQRFYSTVLSSRPSSVTRALEPRFFSANRLSTGAVDTSASAQLPILSPHAVGQWLLISATLVFGVIIIGGVTRLTESGLSVVEWKPITGVVPPITRAEWEEEFEKYKLTPEFKLLNHSISLDEFKSIFYMEWAHRIAGRVVGLAFVLPLAYFAIRKQLGAGLPSRLAGMALLLGAQGALGWYMVKSGLASSIVDDPRAVPRVSQYRLAAHLGTAVVLYGAMLGTGLTILRDWKYATLESYKKLTPSIVETLAKNPIVRNFRNKAWALTALVFLTLMSGAFVAGLDAGLVYNEFPLMGGRLVPPSDELMNPIYAVKPDRSDLWWRNILENPTTVQFDHRVLATITYLCTGLLYVNSRVPSVRAILPKAAQRLAAASFGVANLQVLLGISTLLYLVPVPLAAAHQAGSIALLTGVLQLAISLRPPGLTARLWRQTKFALSSARKI